MARITPSARNRIPIGMRISNLAAPLIPCPRLEEDDVECQCHSQHDHGQYGRLLVPVLVVLDRLWRQAVHESDQLLLSTRPCREADEDRDDEARDPRRNRGPERLAQLAAIDDVRAEVAPFHSRYRTTSE